MDNTNMPPGSTKLEKTYEYAFRLFITGATPNSLRAVANLKELLEQHVPMRYSLEVIDVYQQMDMAEKEQLVALPLLLKTMPLPERRLIGDLSDTQKVLQALGLGV